MRPRMTSFEAERTASVGGLQADALLNPCTKASGLKTLPQGPVHRLARRVWEAFRADALLNPCTKASGLKALPQGRCNGSVTAGFCGRPFRADAFRKFADVEEDYSTRPLLVRPVKPDGVPEWIPADSFDDSRAHRIADDVTSHSDQILVTSQRVVVKSIRPHGFVLAPL